MENKQPFFINLYNLPLSGQIPPTPEEKQKLTKLIRDSHERYIPPISTHQSLPIIYSPVRTFPFEYRENWWKKDYPSFFKEYLHLKDFLQGYLTGKLEEYNLTWFQQALRLFRLDFSFEEKENKTQFSLRIDMASESQNEFLGLAYGEIVSMIIGKKIIKYCQAPETQKSPACSNLFLPAVVGKGQRFCSIKCANRARRRAYYLKKRK